MIFTTPKPPSLNHIYAYSNQGGHAHSYITAEGKAWFEAAGYTLKQQWKSRKTIDKEVEIWIDLYTAYRQDIDNILKPLLDLLTKTGLIKDDSLIFRLTVEKHKCKKTEERVEFQLVITAL